MNATEPQIVVAGHICVDIIPAWSQTDASFASIFQPGSLNQVGPALISTGGAVSNTGIALHRLGVPVRMMGKVGPDLFGRAILDVVRSYDETLTAGMIVAPDADSSYTLVINPPGVDRIFLHCPGANNTFGAGDVDLEQVRGAKVFHFGYPPLMRRMYLDDGAELATLLRAVRALGVTTSLDMAQPDPTSEAGRVDWQRVLVNVLPHVDLFAPSLDEMLFMLDRRRYDAIQRGEDARTPDAALLQGLSQRLLELGAAVVALKLGELGLYLRTSADPARLAAGGALLSSLPASWLGRELLTPCFVVNVAGATGAGDCTIAGLLASLLHGRTIEQALLDATAVGAASVESPDATGGVPAWETVQSRLADAWDKHPLQISADDWQVDAAHQVWHSPADFRTEASRP
ncbi:MAG: carbohydrate kinase family protein [Caldilineaceae bacterium]|jgi:sugar/nucleoside kinase (ribokinase family)|nr:carbohydrate kinase family protein [Caldilineaceae bacterium]